MAYQKNCDNAARSKINEISTNILYKPRENARVKRVIKIPFEASEDELFFIGTMLKSYVTIDDQKVRYSNHVVASSLCWFANQELRKEGGLYRSKIDIGSDARIPANHHCNLVNNSRDAYRYLMQSDHILDRVLSADMRDAIWNDKHSDSFCVHGVQNCDVKAQVGLSCHSMYDIPIADVPKIFEKHDFDLIIAWMYLPYALLDHDLCHVNEEFYKTEVIGSEMSFRFANDMSFAYVHDIENWKAYMTTTLIRGDDFDVVVEINQTYGVLNKLYFRKVPKFEITSLYRIIPVGDVFSGYVKVPNMRFVAACDYDVCYNDVPKIVVKRYVVERLYNYLGKMQEGQVTYEKGLSYFQGMNSRITIGNTVVNEHSDVYAHDADDILYSVLCLSICSRTRRVATQKKFTENLETEFAYDASRESSLRKWYAKVVEFFKTRKVYDGSTRYKYNVGRDHMMFGFEYFENVKCEGSVDARRNFRRLVVRTRDVCKKCRDLLINFRLKNKCDCSLFKGLDNCCEACYMFLRDLRCQLEDSVLGQAFRNFTEFSRKSKKNASSCDGSPAIVREQLQLTYDAVVDPCVESKIVAAKQEFVVADVVGVQELEVPVAVEKDVCPVDVRANEVIRIVQRTESEISVSASVSSEQSIITVKEFSVADDSSMSLSSCEEVSDARRENCFVDDDDAAVGELGVWRDMPRDGHCFYHAMVFAGSGDADVFALRKRLVDFIKANAIEGVNRDEFLANVQCEDDVADSVHYANETVFVAFARMAGISLCVHAFRTMLRYGGGSKCVHIKIVDEHVWLFVFAENKSRHVTLFDENEAEAIDSCISANNNMYEVICKNERTSIHKCVRKFVDIVGQLKRENLKCSSLLEVAIAPGYVHLHLRKNRLFRSYRGLHYTGPGALKLLPGVKINVKPYDDLLQYTTTKFFNLIYCDACNDTKDLGLVEFYKHFIRYVADGQFLVIKTFYDKLYQFAGIKELWRVLKPDGSSSVNKEVFFASNAAEFLQLTLLLKVCRINLIGFLR